MLEIRVSTSSLLFCFYFQRPAPKDSIWTRQRDVRIVQLTSGVMEEVLGTVNLVLLTREWLLELEQVRQPALGVSCSLG